VDDVATIDAVVTDPAAIDAAMDVASVELDHPPRSAAQELEARLRADVQVAAFVRAMNPVHGQPIPAPRMSPEQLRRLAERQRGWRAWTHWRAWRWRSRLLVRRWLIPVTTAVTVAAAATAVVITPMFLDAGRRPEKRPPAGGASAQPWTPLRLAYGDSPPPARPQLAALAAATARLGDDTGSGRYTYVQTRMFALDTTADDPMAVWTVRDERLWIAGDGSGRQATITWRGPAGQPGEPNPSTTTENHGPGGLAVVVPQPSPDRGILAGQLHDHLNFYAWPSARLKAVADLYGYHALTPALRSTALSVLADSDGVDYRGRVVDHADRTGIAVSIDNPPDAFSPPSGGDIERESPAESPPGTGTREVLVFDPDTGRLLAYEQTTLPAGGGPPQLLTSVLYLAHTRTGTLQPPAGQ
jgi:hypothetical protein